MSKHKEWPTKRRIEDPNENYGTKERPSHPKGAEQMNESFGKAGADQDIIREVEQPNQPDQSGKRQGEQGRQ